MGKTDGDRKNISVLLSIEATEKLNNIQTRTGENISQIIERLILGKAPAGALDVNGVGKIRGRMTPERKQLMNLIRQLRIGEGLSHERIADYLDRQKVPTLSGRGRWQQGTIGRLLKKWGIS